MTRPFHVPMSPEELPKQRIVEVVALPSLPEGVKIITDDREMPAAQRRRKRPGQTEFLAALEWAWSPMHNRLQGFSLERHERSGCWVLWSYFVDLEENGDDPWGICAFCPHKDLDEHTAAVQLLIAALREGIEVEGLDHFHWIADTGLLSPAEVRAIGRTVWPKKK